jgi:hypothetical protein
MMEVYYRSVLKHVQTLPDRVANEAPYLILGLPPIEATLDIKTITFFGTIARTEDSIHRQIAQRQLATKTLKSKSWFMYRVKLMFKYGLPSPHLILQLKPSKGRWKNLVTNTVLNYWERSLKTSALEKSSMLLLTADVNGLSLRKEHPVWQWTESNMRDTERARINCFNNYDVDPTCPLCGDGSEDIHHMIASCTAMKSIRTRYLPSLVSVFDFMYE